MGNVVKNFIDVLSAQFTVPRDCKDETKFFGVYVDLLKGQPDDVLRGASMDIVRTRTMRTFPLPAECLAACRDYAEASAKPLSKPSKQSGEWSAERVAAANKLICCDLGVQAVHEGWILGLHDFAREKSRLPDVHESRVIAAQVAALNADIANLPKGLIISPLIKSREDRACKLAEILEKNIALERRRYA